MGDILTSPNVLNEPGVIELGYNINTDRHRMELPEPQDPAASGFCLSQPFDVGFEKRGKIGSTRELAVTDSIRLNGGTFTGTVLDTGMWQTPYTQGTGTAAMVSGQCQLATGITANSNAYITTYKLARFMNTANNYIRMHVQIPDAGVTNNIRRWGAFDLSEGFFFVLNGSTLSVASRMASIDTMYSISGFTLNNYYNMYEIYWDAVGANFLVNDVVVYTIPFTNTVTTTLHFKSTAQNQNTNGATTNVLMNIRGMAICRFGEETSRPVYKQVGQLGTQVLKYGPGTLELVAVSKHGGSANLVTLYDGLTTAAGTEICTLDTVNSGSLYAIYDVDFSGGLTIACSGGTPGDLTITYE